MVGRRRGADDGGAGQHGELHGDRADPAGRAVDQHRVTGSDRPQLPQRDVCGLRSGAESSGHRPGHPAGFAVTWSAGITRYSA